jgi:hypothetical protein
MRQWFKQRGPEYIERQEVPIELKQNQQQMKSVLNSVLNAMVDGYSDSYERASKSVTQTPRSQRSVRGILEDTPSDKIDNTPLTIPSSRASGIFPEKNSSLSLRSRVGACPSSQPLQAIQGTERAGENEESKENTYPDSEVEVNDLLIYDATGGLETYGSLWTDPLGQDCSLSMFTEDVLESFMPEGFTSP